MQVIANYAIFAQICAHNEKIINVHKLIPSDLRCISVNIYTSNLIMQLLPLGTLNRHRLSVFPEALEEF